LQSIQIRLGKITRINAALTTYAIERCPVDVRLAGGSQGACHCIQVLLSNPVIASFVNGTQLPRRISHVVSLLSRIVLVYIISCKELIAFY
jgi:hypothetical protein